MPLLSQWAGMNAQEQTALLSWVVEFVAQKNWEGCQGLKLTDEMKLLIAANAGLLVLGAALATSDQFYFPDVRSVLVYPEPFVAPQRTSIGGGLHLEGETHLEGQAWHRGPVIISWVDVIQPNRGTPHNLVVHEFAHQLDMLNGGSADGVPPMPAERLNRWQQVCQHSRAHLERLCASGGYSILDCYGCEHASEFFAVSSEAFFEAPHELAEQFPDLFAELATFFQVDSRRWVRSD